ncbi:MAG: ATP-binding protein [Actinobacteria bacterium]|nr:ATP-binding protein [Actinomycetota bacterium]
MRGLPAHRLTTAHLQAAYPFVSEGGFGGRGAYIGRDLFGGAFTYDAFELYEEGVITSPNMVVAGQLGRGKSALVKSFALRQMTFGRRIVVMDPKGEYGALAHACGAEAIRLSPRGATKLNPLDRRIAQEEQLRLLYAISAAALDRSLKPFERTALERALNEAVQRLGEATIPLVVDCLLNPTEEAAAAIAADRAALTEWGREAAFELRRLVSGDLRGMFDDATSASVDLEAPMVVLDLSAVYDSDALGILMTCAAAWLQGLLARDASRKTIFVVDEAWAILANLGIAKWLQASFKLSRARGLQNIAVMHRFSDLSATGAQGSQQERVARGLLSDTETKVVYAQPHGEITATRDLLGLTDTEAALLPQLERGIALWKVGERSFLVWHRLGRTERALVDTDARMLRPASA